MTDVLSTAFQSTRQKGRINRSLHVWQRLPDGRWKCVLCGGVAKTPTLNGDPDTFEALTDEERRQCPLPK